MDGWVSEQLKTIENLCEVAQILIDNNKTELLPTVLELLQLETQQIVEENCVINVPDNPEFKI